MFLRIASLLLLASPCFASSTTTWNNQDKMLGKTTYAMVTGLLSGNSTITGSPTYIAPVTFSSAVYVNGSAKFSDSATFSGPSTFTGSAFMPWGRSVWVNFVGTGTIAVMAQLPSGEVSLTDNSEGNYTLTFATAWSTIDSYACSCTVEQAVAGGNRSSCAMDATTPPSESAIRFKVFDTPTGVARDGDRVHVICQGY